MEAGFEPQLAKVGHDHAAHAHGTDGDHNTVEHHGVGEGVVLVPVDDTFTWQDAMRAMGDGAVGTFKEILKLPKMFIEKPLVAIPVTGLTIGGMLLVPWFAPVVTWGALALSGYQIVRGGLEAKEALAAGSIEGAQRGFSRVGHGLTGAALIGAGRGVALLLGLNHTHAAAQVGAEVMEHANHVGHAHDAVQAAGQAHHAVEAAGHAHEVVEAVGHAAEHGHSAVEAAEKGGRLATWFAGIVAGVGENVRNINPGSLHIFVDELPAVIAALTGAKHEHAH